MSGPIAVKTALHPDLDSLIDPILAEATDQIDLGSSFLADMSRYHLGLVDRNFLPLAGTAVDRGKRIRPGIALLCCAAAGGDPAAAAPLAAAIEILHNFTLVHDDIQDKSPIRRHQPTVWSLWGESQAINVGDALFAAAQMTMLKLADGSCSAERIVKLSRAFNQMTIEIVNGQALDLSFEERHDVSQSEYLTMITAKTSVIVRFAAWAGATVGGASRESADAFGRFGLALGLGFQIQDDLLGIWGSTQDTGKAEADDIRRRKKSLPILTLLETVDMRTRDEIASLYQGTEIDSAGGKLILEHLANHQIRQRIEDAVRGYHDLAVDALLTAVPEDSEARSALINLTERLSRRVH